MRIDEGWKQLARAVCGAGALRVAALSVACLLLQAPACAAARVPAPDATQAARRAETAREANAVAGPTVKVNSKSPYAAWRAQRERAERLDTSGHGHRAPRPEGPSHSRRLPQ